MEIKTIEEVMDICRKNTVRFSRSNSAEFTCTRCGERTSVSMRQFKERGKKNLLCSRCEISESKTGTKNSSENSTKSSPKSNDTVKTVTKEVHKIEKIESASPKEYSADQNAPKFETKFSLPSSYSEWKERVEYLKGIVRNIFLSNGIPFEEDVTINGNFHLDFYNREHCLGVEIYDLLSHSCGVRIVDGVENITKSYPHEKWHMAHDLGIRLICAYENEILDSRKYYVFKNMIQYQCGIYNRFYARNTVVDIMDAIEMKKFYERNNIQGYRNAKKVFVLRDKKTGEPLMMYSVGHAFFGNGLYDAELARGACDINYHDTGKGIQVIGGASKLWKEIMEYYSTHSADGGEGKVDSLVYYVDARYYSGSSIGHLMDGDAISSLGTVKQITDTSSFVNYWRDIPENPEDRRGVIKNREPSRNSMIVEGYKNGSILMIPNAGTMTNVFIRAGTALRENTIVK